jgi:hypothetical protein
VREPLIDGLGEALRHLVLRQMPIPSSEADIEFRSREVPEWDQM